ncbi:hypothetical protein P9G43_16110 [Bacillus spizizenii]|nr:hypothetical protein [Bacillus spizizenii]MEC2184122.1 hypothetical protein [Bacillus spizizenii]
MKVKTKLLGIVSILVLSMIGIGGSSVFMISSTVKKNEELKDKMEFQKEMKYIQYRLAGLSNDERGFLITGDTEYEEGMEEKADDVLKSLDRVAATQQLTSGVEVIQHTVHTLAAGTKETSANTEAVAKSSQEQLHSMEEISYAAESLSQLAEELQTVIHCFKY